MNFLGIILIILTAKTQKIMQTIVLPAIKMTQWNIEQETGYKPITTFWQDFSIADKFGSKAVWNTYQQAFKEWKHDYKYITELSLVLNHKIWQHYDPKAKEQNLISRVYNALWMSCDEWCVENLKGEELEYYLRTTD